MLVNYFKVTIQRKKCSRTSKYYKWNENKSIIYRNVWDILREKCVGVNTCNKKWISQINDPIFYKRNLKEKQTANKPRKQKRTGIRDMKHRYTIQRNQWSQNLVLWKN